MTAPTSALITTPRALRNAQAGYFPLALSMLSCLGSCGGGGGGGDGTNNTPSDPAPILFQNVLFERSNANGGSDLYRAPTTGGVAPTAITNNGTKTIDEILNPDQLIADRIVYKGRTSAIASDVNFYSTTTAAGSATQPLTTFSTSSVIDNSYRIVGSTLVFRAFTGVISADIWVVPIDGSAPARNITNLNGSGQANWNTRDVIGSRIFFEVNLASPTREYYVFDTAVGGNPVRLGPTSDRLHLLLNDVNLQFAPTTEAAILASGNNLFLRAERVVGSQSFFQLFSADMTSGSLRQMSDSFSTATNPSFGVERVTGGFVVGGMFCYLIDSNSLGQTNLFAADIASSTPSYRNVTDIPAGSDNAIRWKALLPSQPKVVIANEASFGGSNVTTDLYVVDVAADTKLRILDGSILGANPTESDVKALTVIGNVAVFERARDLGQLWSVPLDGTGPAGTEMLASVPGIKGLDGFIVSNAGSGRTEMFGNDPSFDFTTLSVQNSFAYVTQFQANSSSQDIYMLSVDGTTVQTLLLTAPYSIPPTSLLPRPFISMRYGDRIAYLRGSEWFTTPITGSRQDARITNDFSGVGRLTLDRIYYRALDSNIYSAPIDSDVRTGSTRALTSFGSGSGTLVTRILPNGGNVVMTLQQDLNTKLVSSPYAPNAPSLTDISQTSNANDTLLLLF